MEMICSICGKGYEAARSSSKFCSAKCRMQASRKKSEGAASVPRAEYEGMVKDGKPYPEGDTFREKVNAGLVRVGHESPRVRTVAEGSIAASHYEDGMPMHPMDLVRERTHPGYHNFLDHDEEHECNKCLKKFTTRLKLLKFCSPECHPTMKSDTIEAA